MTENHLTNLLNGSRLTTNLTALNRKPVNDGYKPFCGILSRLTGQSSLSNPLIGVLNA